MSLEQGWTGYVLVDGVKAHYFPAFENYHSRTQMMSSTVNCWKSLSTLSLGDKEKNVISPNLGPTASFYLYSI